MRVADSTIGPYILVRSLGRGGFGEVWMAERRSSLLTTRVALKLPILDEGDIEQIRQEAQIWLQASGHPNIVPVLDAEVYDGQVVIASEYIAGGTLTGWLDKHGGTAPSIEAAAAKAAGILGGLDYLHRAGLVHRDLKPDNILLQDGAPRLTDFGLARFSHVSDVTENISGTPRYMAPEAFSGNFSAASDLWSVGVIFYEMLAGARPFPEHDIMELILAIQSRAPDPLSGAIPERYRDVILRLLAKAPGDRFSSAADALAALQSAPSPSIQVSPSTWGDRSAGARKHNLPAQLTSFVGREREQAEILEMLEKTRLLTLTGSGGCGKTRLAVQIAEQVLPKFDDGVWMVELAALNDPDLAVQSVAAVLEIAEAPGQPLLQSLTLALKSRRMLLILDNCEHLVAAVASLADGIMRACPNVKIVASSREPLNVAGERTYRVPSLALPAAGQTATATSLQQVEGVRLFVERATASSPDFRLTDENAPAVASVCRRLDGIPLAIELAAARTRSLSVEQIAHKLDDRFRLLTGGSRSALPRQQTLRSLIDWSYSLLTEPERTLLRRLSVFAGGWTLEAAEAICPDAALAAFTEAISTAGGAASSAESQAATALSAEQTPLRPGDRVLTVQGATGASHPPATPIEDWEVLDLLTALGDKSLLSAERQGQETRYRFLETVRQYATERLSDSGEEAAVRRAHRDYYLALAEQAEQHYSKPGQGEWLARLEQEHDNLRAALEWCHQEPDGTEAGLCIAGALWRFWHTSGYLSEGREQLTRALARSDDTMRTIPRAKALNGCALLTWCQGEDDAAEQIYQASAAISQELESPFHFAASRIGIGLVMLDRGEIDDARTVFEETRARCADIGDDWGQSLSLNNLGLVAGANGDARGARALHEEALSIRRRMADQWGIAMSLNNLGILAVKDGDFGRARSLLCESLAIRRAVRDKAGIAYSLTGLGTLATEEGDLRRAACLFGAEEALRESMGAAIAPSARADYSSILSRLQNNDGEYALPWQQGRALTLEQAIDFALSQ